MAIKSIRLQHFRSYKDATFELGKKVNMVIGPNGSGKTNLLEALYVVARGKSFRVSDADLLQYDTAWLRLDTVVDDHTRSLTLKKEASAVQKRLILDGAVKARLSAREKLRVVLFEPRDMQLLTGSPERRRSFLDDILEQLETGYGRTLGQYRRALMQRNTLLKHHHKVPADHLFVWNVRLSELGAQIIEKRRRLIASLNELATETYKNISGSEATVAILYQSKLSTSPDERLGSTMLHALEKNYQQDKKLGFTSVGPHRDDIVAVLNGAAASTSASRGETRSLVVMLKLLEAKLLTVYHQTKPLILLDDVFGELDKKRQQSLAGYLVGYQTVITATDAHSITEELKDPIKVLKL